MLYSVRFEANFSFSGFEAQNSEEALILGEYLLIRFVCDAFFESVAGSSCHGQNHDAWRNSRLHGCSAMLLSNHSG